MAYYIKDKIEIKEENQCKRNVTEPSLSNKSISQEDELPLGNVYDERDVKLAVERLKEEISKSWKPFVKFAELGSDQKRDVKKIIDEIFGDKLT